VQVQGSEILSRKTRAKNQKRICQLCGRSLTFYGQPYKYAKITFFFTHNETGEKHKEAAFFHYAECYYAQEERWRDIAMNWKRKIKTKEGLNLYL